MEIHSRKMNVGPNVNFAELAASTDEFNGAQLKAVVRPPLAPLLSLVASGFVRRRRFESLTLPSPLLLSRPLAQCVEAGMIALREGARVLEHEHFHSGILEVQSKKKNDQFVRPRPSASASSLPPPGAKGGCR